MRAQTIESYFRLLGINENVSLNELKSTYRKLAKKYHPDTKHHSNEVFLKQTARHFSAITNAYNEIYKRVVTPKVITVNGRLGFTIKRVEMGAHVFPMIQVVKPYSPAHAAGIREGDVIIAFNDRSTRDLSMKQLKRILYGNAGEAVKITINRNGKIRNIFCIRDKSPHSIEIRE